MSSGPAQSLPFHRADSDLAAESTADALDRIALNYHNAAQNIDIPASFSSNPQIHLSTESIAPLPHSNSNSSLDGSSSSRHISPSNSNSLRIQTDIPQPTTPPPKDSVSRSRSLKHKSSHSSLRPVARTPSVKKSLAAALGSASTPGSCVSSPVISALGDVTPLPSPLLTGDSPGPWKRYAARRPSKGQMVDPTPDSVLVSATGESIAAALVNASKRKQYAALGPEGAEAKKKENQDPSHGRNRSVSEYVPDPMALPKRHITVSGSHAEPVQDSEQPMRREANLAQSRGLTATGAAKPPTPPPSDSSKHSVDGLPDRKPTSGAEYFEAYGRFDGKKRRWRAVKFLGQGTFSRVMLATSQSQEDDESPIPTSADPESLSSETAQKMRRTLVAVKVCEHGPRGGASEERIEMSLKRELEIMQSINYPSLVQLKAWSIEQTRAILIMSYCVGGDLFDVATQHRELLSPPLLRRMFAELVGAVQYLHQRRICHRDIKLENVLVNLSPDELSDPSVDWATYPHSVITLTDLGLSRRIADDEKLETRCGSEDYAAPEVIMGLPYDGKATDAWSLGVLLYALLESRLPFDPPPNTADSHRMRSRTSHRIARIEWCWINYAGDDGKHEGSIAKFEERGLLGAMEITEKLIDRARQRWTLDQVADTEWVKGAIQLPEGIRFREEAEAEEVA
ncbi:kinase-like domain-containing protein [Plectosphaerella plurivora]|uniref:Kinase-like domain-containing protein n=1 Tax=Plectosphaerella plurivora TaxID=936078 RepID=A0A9P8V0N8_9PEZI|nr:kinase-like domain-containing protein [Plectosphaerella plurivora]